MKFVLASHNKGKLAEMQAILGELGVPVKFVGVGEGIDDLKPFDPAEFVQGMV